MSQSTQIEKVMPTIEQSLKSISWHLKVLVDELKGLRATLESKKQDFNDMPF